MRTYYSIIDCDDASYEGGEVIRRCQATNRRQAERRLGISEQNAHILFCYSASKMPSNVYDPKLLVTFGRKTG